MYDYLFYVYYYTMDKIRQLENELKELKYQEFMKQQKESQRIKAEYQKKEKIDVWWSDDYYYASIWDTSFYYGYEVTMCKKHPKIDDCEDRYDCEKREWCFTAHEWDKEIMRIPESDLSPSCRDVADHLMCWILLYIKSIKNG